MRMVGTLWEMPVPASALTRGPSFSELPRRQCELAFHVETSDGSEERVVLIFEGVEAYKCTYMMSLDVRMIEWAYGKIAHLRDAPWFEDVRTSYTRYCQNAQKEALDLQHLMICFDDGPCYEFVCGGFRCVQT